MSDVQELTRGVCVLIFAAVLFASPASGKPTSPLCQDGSYRSAHPLICDTGGPMPDFTPPSGGGPGEGLLGRILRGLGLGGLL